MTTILGKFHPTAEGLPLRNAPTALKPPGPDASPEKLREFVVKALPSGRHDWLTSSEEKIKEFATFCRICMKDDTEAVARLVDQYSLGLPWRFINDIDREGRTPLMRAIGEQDQGLVDKLLQEGATSDVNALIQAIKEDVPLGILEKLVTSDSARQQNREGDCALTVAARTGNVEAVELLLSIAGAHDETALYVALCAAAAAGHNEIVRMILDLAEAVIDPAPALQLLSKYYDPAMGSDDIFEELLSFALRKPEQYDGWNIILDALCLVAEKHDEFVELSLASMDGRLLAHATTLNHARAVKLLLDAGSLIHGCTGYKSVLHYELDRGRAPSCEVAELFLKRFKERNVNWGGTRCIERAASFGNLDLVLLLKRYGSPTTPEVEKWIKEYLRQDGMQ